MEAVPWGTSIGPKISAGHRGSGSESLGDRSVVQAETALWKYPSRTMQSSENPGVEAAPWWRISHPSIEPRSPWATEIISSPIIALTPHSDSSSHAAKNSTFGPSSSIWPGDYTEKASTFAWATEARGPVTRFHSPPESSSSSPTEKRSPAHGPSLPGSTRGDACAPWPGHAPAPYAGRASPCW